MPIVGWLTVIGIAQASSANGKRGIAQIHTPELPAALTGERQPAQEGSHQAANSAAIASGQRRTEDGYQEMDTLTPTPINGTAGARQPIIHNQKMKAPCSPPPVAMPSPEQLLHATQAHEPVNAIVEAVNQCKDALLQIIEHAKPERSGDANKCGLLNFREWWELVDVCIYVNGQLIRGVPIFVKGDTLRVVDQGYSYFIPLEKVDYIRTNDGLCFDSSLSGRQK